MGKPIVYMTKDISPKGLVKIYEALNPNLPGNLAVKLHTGEPGGNNYLKPELISELVKKVNGTIIEANTAYNGRRYSTADHYEVAKEHGFTDIANVDIIDGEGELTLSIPNGKWLKENYVGADLEKYESILVLSHFKGHAMGGFGGAVKNISIGIASGKGKAWIHSAGTSFTDFWNTPQDDFLESMAEAAKSVTEYCKNMAYINVMNNLSVSCDCESNPEPPCMADIGIFASLDPVAVDKACVDQVYNSPDENKAKLIERIETRHGTHTLDYAEEIDLGSKDYELVCID